MILPYTNIQSKSLKKCIEKLGSSLETVSLWPSNNSLVFNDDKTKLMLFSTTQLSYRHNDCEVSERVNTKKILGIYFDENLSWSYNVNNVIQSSYATLRSLCQFKRFTPYKVCKSLVETLIISKIRYCLVVYSQLTKYQFNDYKKIKIGLLVMY